MNPLQLLGNILIYEVTLAQLVFVLFYTVRSPWYRNIVGVAIWLANVSLFILGANTSLALLFGVEYPGREVVRIALFLLVAISVNFSLATLLHIQALPPSPREQNFVGIYRKKDSMTNTTTEAPVSLIPKSPAEVAKAIVYIALTAFGLIAAAQTDGDVSIVEILNISIAIVFAIPVYLLAGALVKTIVAFAGAGLQALVVVFVGGVAGFGSLGFNDWVTVAFAAFAAIGIAVVPNKPMIDAGTARDGAPVTVTNL